MLVAFCDDMPDTVQYTINILKEQVEIYGLTTDIKIYEEPASMLVDIMDKDISYDMYFLDIEMPTVDGIDLAAKIRQVNPRAIILFLSCYTCYGDRVCRTHADAYMYKAGDADTKREDIGCAIRKYIRRTSTYTFPISRDEERTVFVSDIVYIESLKRQIIVHMKNNTSFHASDKYSLSYFEEQDEFKDFFRISRSILIGCHNIETIRDKIFMCTGEVFKPRQSVMSKLKSKLLYLLRDSAFE